MARRTLPLALTAAALIASATAAPASAGDKDVVVVNGATNPVPVQTQGTVAVTGGVNVLNTPSVNVANVPAVQLAPGATVSASQGGPWAVSVVQAVSPPTGTLTLGAGTSNAIGPTPIFTASFSLAASLATGGSGGGAGKTTFEELVVTRTMDASSVALFLAAAQGRIFATGSVVVNDSSGAAVARFDLGDVVVTSLKEGTNGSASPLETVGLGYGRIVLTTGGSSAGWDVTENRVQ
jgi:type VI secretion system secreted protein Hcp